jgi:multidrug efflux pump
MRFQGKEALGIGVTMVKGGDVIELGRDLTRETERIQQALPVGVELASVASMPRAVQRSINQFLRSLAEAVIIVLAVSLISLGFRTGLVVAVSIPLVLAVTFLVMWLTDIGLHKISLGALILSLGLLVDDAIIAVEMMAIKLEQGFDRFRAASFAYTSTAFPMLTGTLITVAGFLPIATAKSSTGEYTRSIFEVSAIALIASWVVAVVVIPYLGYKMLPEGAAMHEPSFARRWWSKVTGRALPPPVAPDHDVYATPFYERLRRHRVVRRPSQDGDRGHARRLRRRARLFRWCRSSSFRRRRASSCWSTCASPKAARSRLDERRAEARGGARQGRRHRELRDVRRQRRAALLPAARPAAHAVELRADGGHAKSIDDREKVRSRLLALFDTDFPQLRGRVSRLENGPPSDSPCSSASRARTSRHARHRAQVAAVMRSDPQTSQVQFDWDEPSKVIRVAIDQNKARVLGISSQELASFLNNSLSRLLGHVLPRARQADRGAPARRDRRARAHQLPQGSRDPVAQRPRGADHADRRHRVRARGRHRLAAQSPADDHRALRRRRQRAGPDVAKRIEPSSATFAPRCRSATGSSSAARSRTRRAAEVDRRRHAAARARRADAAHAAASKLLAHGDGRAHRAARVDRRRHRVARVRQAVRLRGDARHDRARRHHHAQLGDPRRPDRPGHQVRAHAVGRGDRRDGAPLPADRAHRAAAVLALIPLVRSDFFGPMAWR